MKKKLLALLLAALMLVSIFPVTALAEGEAVEENQVEEVVNEVVSQPDPTIVAANALMASGEMPQSEPTDPDEVHDALDTAIDSELNAAGNYSPLNPTGIEEGLAAGFDAAADEHLENAEGVTEFSDGFTDFLADRAEEHADNAAQDALDAADAADAAEGAAADAAAALQDAENANSIAGVNAAAAAAQDASVAAQKAAANALAAAEDAAAEAERAQNDYVIAQAAYEAAKAEVEEQLALGLFDAQTAEILTADAAAKADAAYKAMLAAQEAAEAAVKDAQEKADAADADLQEKIDVLEQAIAANAANVAAKTGVTVLTGAALAAAKLAAEATKLQVGYYEGQFNRTQAKIDVLEQRIADAEQAIEDAEKAVEEAEKTLAEAEEDADYQQKMAELEQAKEALEAAQSTVAVLQEIVDALSDEDTGADLSQAVEAVKADAATAAQKKAIAEEVIKAAAPKNDDDSAKELSWVETEEGSDRLIFELDGKFYEVVTVGEEGSKFLQFQEVEHTMVPSGNKIEAEASDLPAADADTWKTLENDSVLLGYGTKKTGLSAMDEENKEYEIVLDKSLSGYTLQVKVGNNYYDLVPDEEGDGFHYTTRVKVGGTILKPIYEYTDHPLTLLKPEMIEGFSEADPAAAYAAASDLLLDSASKLSAAEGDMDAAEGNKELAEAAAKSAADAAGVTAAKNAYDAARETLNNFKAGKEADEESLAELKQDLEELDDKLNGSLIEQLAVSFFDDGTDGIWQTLADKVGEKLGAEKQEQYESLIEQYNETSSLITKALLLVQAGAILRDANLSSEVNLSDFSNIIDQASAMAELVQAFSDGDFNLDDVSLVLDLLTGNGFSAKTKEFIMSKIVEVLAGIHENAVAELKEAVEKGIEEVADATEEAAESALNAASAHAALEIAKAAKTLADALVEDAAEKKAAAEQAAADAALAAELYEALAETYGPTDENVQRAKEAAEAAEEYAALTAAEAERAQEAADRAKADYEKAQEIADDFPAKLAAAIARYAWSLKGDGYAKLVEDESKLTGKDFVDHVFSHFGFKLNLDGSLSDIGGFMVNNAYRAPADLIAVTGTDGSVTGLGVNYGLDGLDGVVQLDEASGEVVMTAPADLGEFTTIRMI